MNAKPRILIVEDEPSVADNITYALGTEGFDPVWCSTGEEARQVITEQALDLIILDVGLPDVNGFDLCREIRKTSTVPVIFLTARTDEIDRVVGLEIGGDDYVVKPFSPRELTARIKAVLRRTSDHDEQSDRVVEVSGLPFEIDQDRCVIRYQGTPLTLTRYEFRILEILIRRPGRVYSRETLMDQAWEEPDASMERTVDAHIKSIRAKLHQVDPDGDPIVTHRGIGYALKEDW